MSTEISSRSYLEFVVDLLKANGGVMETAEVEKEVWKAFRRNMSAADKRVLRGRNLPKWKNALDWAKATATRKGIFTSCKVAKKKYLVLLDSSVTDEEWIQLALDQKRRKDSFKKRCGKCQRWNPLGRGNCRYCGARFPSPNNRRYIRKRIGE